MVSNEIGDITFFDSGSIWLCKLNIEGGNKMVVVPFILLGNVVIGITFPSGPVVINPEKLVISGVLNTNEIPVVAMTLIGNGKSLYNWGYNWVLTVSLSSTIIHRPPVANLHVFVSVLQYHDIVSS